MIKNPETAQAEVLLLAFCWLLIELGFGKTGVVTTARESLSFIALLPMLSLVPDGICWPTSSRAAAALAQVITLMPEEITPEERLQQPSR